MQRSTRSPKPQVFTYEAYLNQLRSLHPAILAEIRRALATAPDRGELALSDMDPETFRQLQAIAAEVPSMQRMAEWGLLRPQGTRVEIVLSLDPAATKDEAHAALDAAWPCCMQRPRGERRCQDPKVLRGRVQAYLAVQAEGRYLWAGQALGVSEKTVAHRYRAACRDGGLPAANPAIHLRLCTRCQKSGGDPGRCEKLRALVNRLSAHTVRGDALSRRRAPVDVYALPDPRGPRSPARSTKPPRAR